ncbi:RHS repeat protein, partial [bacterium]|nr:RHS repeat protein [bacterium]
MTCLDYENNITQTDALNRTTSWEYDNLGRVTKRVLPLSQEESFKYDAVGNVLTQTDFNGNTTSFEYNQNNKLITKIYQDNSVEQFTWTAIGRQDTVIDARGTTINYYDAGNRLTKAVNPDGSAI